MDSKTSLSHHKVGWSCGISCLPYSMLSWLTATYLLSNILWHTPYFTLTPSDLLFVTLIICCAVSCFICHLLHRYNGFLYFPEPFGGIYCKLFLFSSSFSVPGRCFSHWSLTNIIANISSPCFRELFYWYFI